MFYHYTHLDPLDPSSPYVPDPYKSEEDANRICVPVASVTSSTIVLFIIVSFFTSCTTTKYVPVIETHTDTLRLTQIQRDSVFLHDSTIVQLFGDTVRIEKWHTQYRDRLRIDTAYISRRDSIPVPYPVEKRVPAELSWWQQARLHLANIILIALALLAALWLLKKKLPWLPFGK